jgi:hypothetical protein
MSDFNHYKYLQLKAIDSILNPNDIYFQRKICRWYSKEFNTSLEDTFKLPFDTILAHYYESEFEKIPRNDLIDILTNDFIEELSAEKDEGLNALLKKLEEEQDKILRKRQSLNNQDTHAVKNQHPTSDQSLQPEDVVMNFSDDDFNDE